MHINFEFAKWNVQRLKSEIEEKPYKKEFLQGQLSVWRALMIASCPQHDYEEIKESEYESIHICKHCNNVMEFDEAHGAYEQVAKGCHNCRYHEQDGGDAVPYGSTVAYLPVNNYCTHEAFWDDAKEESKFQEMNEQMMDSINCTHWEGKEVSK